MKDAQSPSIVSFNNLINRLREGRFVIPDFQREFEWVPWDINALLRSVFLDYYIGSLLLWKAMPETLKLLACEPIYGYKKETENEPTYIVLDGQQRLTALYYACMAPNKKAPKRKNRFLYFIHVDLFMEESYEEAFDYDWTNRGKKLLEDRVAQFKEHMFPLAVIGKGGWELPTWMQGYEAYWRDKESKAKEAGNHEEARIAGYHAKNALKFGDHVRGITEQYQVAYIELDGKLGIDKICDIFTQINSRGIRLDIFDLLNALLKPKGVQLKRMWRDNAHRLDFVEIERMNVYVLQAMSIRCQGYCSPKYLYYLLPGQQKQVREKDGSLSKKVLVADGEDFKRRWQEAVDGLECIINLLRNPGEYGAIAFRYFPYVSILPIFTALETEVCALQAQHQLKARRKLRYWYWASVFTKRYSGSAESTSARDYSDMRDWFADDEAEPHLITEFRTQFKYLDLWYETKRGSSVYNGIFNLLIINGARDWMSGSVPQHDDRDDIHIVPKSWGNKHGDEIAIDSILNRAPLTHDTNRKLIKDRLPNEYLPELIQTNGKTTVRSTLESHFISPAALDILMREEFTPKDFEEFLKERLRTIKEAIEELLIKERLDLSPRLRELDASIERIELALRRLVDKVLESNVETLPPGVAQKIESNIQREMKKNAAFDTDYYKTLAGKLEFSDLRHLQEIITAKSLWPRFSDRFASKDTLAGKFDQLARLRNGIRHSRAIDEVGRKEGEAAILWFGQVLD